MEVLRLDSKNFIKGEKVVKVIWISENGDKVVYCLHKTKYDKLVSGK